MYIPAHFEQPSIEAMDELIRTRPLATLVTLSSNGINANHIPLHFLEAPLPFGTLRGHVARSNPMWRDLEPDVEALAIFHGPDAYISPSWYATKQETGKVVPTWNYTVVHAYGFLRIIDDAAWIRSQLEALTDHNEAILPEPWAVSDAPEDFTDKLIEAIVGIEMVITRLSGKWKVSQNQPSQNQASVIHGLNNSEQKDALAMAALVTAGGKN
ncbi:MAG: FMN-binding negative transcriptional regulator [Methylococcaceae bacterium]|jgi:transcriptional regulator|nr:FMN-binding negative transcriptional regulator [Methylococcaceae bacterium]MDZ4156480.1 FMN-binding negative transcriptional regulator [Methylococcales bacterium]MDP2391696.1 FMN-binding negative transcriptional regulator [Methylococcaceae bacterium]MDP3018196.1 FMN-binding negative transcriptional regulator [Methylococcaceae bacterium]MDP3389408.1 FMN-binding negative transcriptional regulator [Methylococcaceae bacterium]